ncbi:hypothetical protein WICANDRAFT_86967 [Wickerhamomyces anomalus NRRL Y-366-8]|uniref:Uncharacterized protein n=1 Tax=Wickerhamomyces anomalus (strain ATCC 58044 / CBS 1984 / NCYC 433 / NRRL Y-366-8) TaxID=683960 RepID=A0A1E3PAM9_WICAA|nr:uncharacterized protein WICANDRAFT_86967 [Wickerhamomyces anomalus NRRL Y-366-8]ODQ61927.1 hypothetical protein WICANDRAFT_86967 [Wickerhamomyces anomalus NRRL Y-366-8]
MLQVLGFCVTWPLLQSLVLFDDFKIVYPNNIVWINYGSCDIDFNSNSLFDLIKAKG